MINSRDPAVRQHQQAGDEESAMYAVVGCSECSSLWVVGGDPETTECPTCGRRHRFRQLKHFVETDDEDHAREVRASMLAARQGHGHDFAELDSFAELGDRAEAAGVDDETYLEESGVDTEAVAAAADRADEGAGTGGASRREVVLGAVRDLDDPDEEGVVGYARERGVPPEKTREALAKLVRAGEVSRSGGRYRLL
jgi:hypothetical protein